MGGDDDIAMFYLQAISFCTESGIVGQLKFNVAVLFNRNFKTCCGGNFIVEVPSYPYLLRIGCVECDSCPESQFEMIRPDFHFLGLWDQCQCIIWSVFVGTRAKSLYKTCFKEDK